MLLNAGGTNAIYSFAYGISNLLTLEVGPSGNQTIHRYGDTTFLTEVVAAGSETARELVPSRAERKLRRDLASNNAEPQTVALALY